jgi:YgiT-type zinc finger domain-containing protein
MIPFKKCPICGGDIALKEVEKLLRGGNNTGIVRVRAEVCLRCGERLYSQEVIDQFEHIRSKLARQEVADFELLGQTYQVAV